MSVVGLQFPEAPTLSCSPLYPEKDLHPHVQWTRYLSVFYRANALASLPPPEHFLTDKVPPTLTYSWADQSTIVGAFSLRVSAYGDQSISFVLHILATNQVARAVRTGFEPVFRDLK